MPVGPGFLISLLSVTAASYLCVLLIRRRSSVAARPLLAFAVLVFLTLVAHTTLYVPGPVRSAFVAATGVTVTVGPYFHLQAIFTSLAGTLWFLFALQYTGRGDRLGWLARRVLVVTWAVIVLLLGGSWVAALTFRGRPLFELLLSLTLFTMTGLFVLGTMLVAETAWRRNAVGLREVALLAGGATTFSVTSLVSWTAPLPATTPTVFLLGTLQLTAALRTYPVFEALPVARVAGRDRLIEELDDAVLVVDTETRLRDRNERAGQVFDLQPDVDGSPPLHEVVPGPLDPNHLAQRTEPATVRTTDGVVLAVTADPVTDRLGRQFGHVLRCTDVTDRRQREQRRRLVYRLLTGRLNDQLSTIAETAGDIQTDRVTDTAEAATDITEAVGSLKMLVAGTRRIEQAVAEMEPTTIVVSDLVTAVVDDLSASRVHAHRPEATVEATVDGAVLQAALSMLLETLLSVTQGDIEVTVEDGESGPEIRIVVGATEESGTHGEQRQVTREIVRLAIQSQGGTVDRITGPGERERLQITLPPGTEEVEIDE